MKHKSVIEIETNSIVEEQFILKCFPHAIWIALGERTKFYVPYQEYSVVEKVINEWENKNG